MRGELESPNLEGRYARLCPEHRCVLEGLECPRGHHVETWLTFDRHKGTTLHEVAGDEAQIVDRPSSRTLEPPRNPAPKPEKENDVAAPSTKLKKKLVQSERLEDAVKAVLYVQLVSLSGGDPRVEIDRWRISWRHVGPNKVVAVGIAATAPDEAKARKAYDQVVGGAERAGWQKLAAFRGTGRAIILRPVPAPRSMVGAGRPRARAV